MTNAALERVEQTGTAVDVPAAEQRRLAALMKQCVTLAKSDLVPKGLKGNADNIFALALYGERFGLSPIHAIQRIYLVEGQFMEKAEVLGGVIMRAGHELRWDEVSSDRCTVSIRRQGSGEWQSTSWTLDDARRAGLLDMWVENRVQDGQWPDGNAKYRTEKFVVGDDNGVYTADERARRALGPVPEWAQTKLDAGDVKRSDVWAKYPGDMLAAKALRRAAKRIVGDALLGFDVEHDQVDAFTPDTVLASHAPGDGPDADEPAAEPEQRDDGIEDADVVVEPEPAPPIVEPEPQVEVDPEPAEPALDPAAARDMAMKRLMVTCGKAFAETDAPKGTKTRRQTLLRHAAQFAVFQQQPDRQRVSAADLTADELDRVERWVHGNFVDEAAVSHIRYEILDGDVVRFTLGDRSKDIPPAADAPAAA